MAAREIQPDLLADDVDEWPISNRARNALKAAQLTSPSSFEGYTLNKLKEIKGLGPGGVMEVREFLFAKFGVVLKAEKKKVLKEPVDSKRIVLHLLGKEVKDWARQLKVADQLLRKYTAELLLSVRPNEKAYSLSWYNSEYGHKYIMNKSASEIIEGPIKEDKIDEPSEAVEFIPIISYKPKTLKEFLSN